jgi:hypothetical protein
VRKSASENLAIGTLGLASLARPGWVLPAALAGGLYYRLAGIGHILCKTRNLMEQIALISDLAIFALLAVFVASRAF